MDSLLDLVTDLPPQSGGWSRGTPYSPGSHIAEIALELAVLGQREASAAMMDRALAWFSTQPASERRFGRAQALYWGERWPDTDTLFAALIAEAPENLNYRGYRGVVLAHLGR